MWAHSPLTSQASQGILGVWGGHFSSSLGSLEAQSVWEQVFLDDSESVSGFPGAQIMVDSHIPGLASCLSQIMETLLVTTRQS